MGSTASADCVAVPTEAPASGLVSASGSDSNDSENDALWITLVVLMVLLGFGAAAAFFLFPSLFAPVQVAPVQDAPVQDREDLKIAPV
jgi:hypothetical protein